MEVIEIGNIKYDKKARKRYYKKHRKLGKKDKKIYKGYCYNTRIKNKRRKKWKYYLSKKIMILK